MAEACNDSQHRQNACGLGTRRRKYGGIESGTKHRTTKVSFLNDSVRYSLAPWQHGNKLIAYGMGPTKLYNELNGQGFPVTFDEARGLFDRYGKKFATAVGYLRGKGREAREKGYLANLDGRRRYWRLPQPDEVDNSGKPKFPYGVRDPFYQGILAKIEREGGNFMIQSVNVDMTKKAMVDTRDYRKANNVKTHFVNAIYDEIVTRTKKDQSESFHAAKLKIMQQAAEIWMKRVPMVVDGAVNPYWTK